MTMSNYTCTNKQAIPVRRKMTITLRIYRAQFGSKAGGSIHGDSAESCSDDVCRPRPMRIPDPAGESGAPAPRWPVLDPGRASSHRRLQREAIAMDSTFKTNSCDWRTSIGRTFLVDGGYETWIEPVKETEL